MFKNRAVFVFSVLFTTALLTLTMLVAGFVTYSFTVTVTVGNQAPNASAAATYYVSTSGSDSNPGSSSSPWRTIQKAVNTANAGDTIYVKGGTYNERISFPKSGSSGAYITLAANPGESVIIDGNGKVGDWDGVVRVSSKSWIIVKGFTIANSRWNGVMIDNFGGSRASNIIIQNNLVRDIGYSGLYAQGGDIITYDGNTITNTQTHGFNGPTGKQENENVNMLDVNNFEIKNNKIYATANFESIDVKLGGNGGKIHHNDIKPTMSAGIYLDAWDGTLQNIQVYDNYVHDGTGSTTRGIAVAAEQGGAAKYIKIYNNIVANTPAIGIAIPWYSKGPVDNVEIYNNVIYKTDTVAKWMGGIGIEKVTNGGSNTNIFIRNNIVSQNSVAQINNGIGSSATITNNLIDGSGGITGSNYATGSPQFANAAGGDFHISSSSPAIDKGYNAGAPYNVDYAGASRPVGSAYDIGAYEYGGAASTATPAPTTPTPTPAPTQTPASGKTIPGRIEAESYNAMNGIQTTATSDGGTKVGWIEAGDWMDYSVSVQTSGTYSVKYRVATWSTDRKIELRKGTTVLNTVTLPNTGGSDTFTTVTSTVNLTAGSQILRLYTTTGSFDINWIEFASSTALSCNSVGSGNFFGCYYDNKDFTNLQVTRTDSSINFDWGTGSPNSLIGADTFSAIWQGKFSFEAGDYEFTAVSDDGFRLVVDGVYLLDKWLDQSPTTYKVTKTMTAGTHNVVMSYYENAYGAVAKLSWAKKTATPTPTPTSTPAPTSTPISGKTIPGRIEAESYNAMNGIQTTATSDGGTKVGWIESGDWMDYSVNVQASGAYTVKYRVASTSSTSKIELRKGTTVLNTVTLPNTGGSDTFTTVTSTVNLTAGSQILRLYTTTGGFDINWVEFTYSKTIPGRIEAESYNSMYGVQKTATSDGGTKVGWIESGDWMDYNVYVQTSGTYTVKYRVATWNTGKSIQLRKGTTTLHTVNFPNTGGSDTFTTVSSTVNLTAGAQTLRLYTSTGSFDINWIEFSK